MKDTGRCAMCKLDKRICMKEEGRAPVFCSTVLYPEAIKKSAGEYQKPEIKEFARQASLQESECYINRDSEPFFPYPVKPRLQERVPADIRAAGGIARMADPVVVLRIMDSVTIPVMAKCRIGHFVEAQVLQSLGVDYIDESEVLTPADDKYHINKHGFKVPFVCGARNLGEALRRIGEGAAMIRTKGEPGTGNVIEAVRHIRQVNDEIRWICNLPEEELMTAAKELVRTSVEETLNELLEQEAAELINAGRYERTEDRQGYRSGHYERNLTTTSGEVKLKMPKLKGIAFETAIIERYRRRESSVEEALIEMYLAGVSVRRVEDITEALWGTKVSAGKVKKGYAVYLFCSHFPFYHQVNKMGEGLAGCKETLYSRKLLPFCVA
jgi:hypothetical protein